mgnify:CR=1 FL=1
MSALLFPGQGSQIVGMGSEFFQKFKLVKDIFKQADENLGFNLSKIILEGPEDQLQLTKHAQPAILTVSYSIFKVLKEEFNFNLSSFNFFAGHGSLFESDDSTTHQPPPPPPAGRWGRPNPQKSNLLTQKDCIYMQKN